MLHSVKINLQHEELNHRAIVYTIWMRRDWLIFVNGIKPLIASIVENSNIHWLQLLHPFAFNEIYHKKFDTEKENTKISTQIRTFRYQHELLRCAIHGDSSLWSFVNTREMSYTNYNLPDHRLDLRNKVLPTIIDRLVQTISILSVSWTDLLSCYYCLLLWCNWWVSGSMLSKNSIKDVWTC